MQHIPISFSPIESLELVKYHNPKCWAVDIRKYHIGLLTFMINHQETPTAALNFFIKKSKDMAERIFAMAAYQNIMNKEVESYNKVIEDISNVTKQQAILNETNTISQKDRNDLNEFYFLRLGELDEKKQSLLQVKEVCHALQVQFETVNASVK